MSREAIAAVLVATTGPLDGTVHIHCTDIEGEWFVRADADDADALVVTEEHRKGDAAMRGSAADLLAVLRGDLPLDAVEVIGDTGAAARLIARTNLA